MNSDLQMTIENGILKKYNDGQARWIELPEGIREIAPEVFAGNAWLESVKLPASLRKIGKGAFKNCRSLQRVYAASGRSTFRWMTGLRKGEKGFCIGDEAFAGCTLLERVELPKDVRYIGSGAFRDCWSLQACVLPEIGVRLGEDVFAGCDQLGQWRAVTGTVIGDEALADREDLVEYTLLPGIRFIGKKTFRDCRHLRKVVCSPALQRMGQLPFAGCRELEELDLSAVKELQEGWTLTSAFAEGHAPRKVILPRQMQRLPAGFFKNMTGLQEVVLPEGLQSIGEGAFQGCASLDSIEIPDSVTEIGAHAFGYCMALRSVTLPAGMTCIADGTFEHCHNLQAAALPAGLKCIGASAFDHCRHLEQMTLPEGLLEIGAYAFAGCTGPKMLHLPESLQQVGKGAFRHSGGVQLLDNRSRSAVLLDLPQVRGGYFSRADIRQWSYDPGEEDSSEDWYDDRSYAWSLVYSVKEEALSHWYRAVCCYLGRTEAYGPETETACRDLLAGYSRELLLYARERQDIEGLRQLLTWEALSREEIEKTILASDWMEGRLVVLDHFSRHPKKSESGGYVLC